MEYREQFDPLNLMRIESSVNHLFRPTLSEEEKQLLDEHLDFLMENNVYANYFLSYLSFRMRCAGSNQMQIDYRGFVGLKDKYLKILSSSRSSTGIDSNDLRISLVGELIFSASQIYYKCADGELVSLIEHLDCPIMKEYKIWEVYFLYRVCKCTATNVLSKQHFLCSLSITADALDSNDKIIRLADQEFRHLVKLVKEGEHFHNVALKDIAYYWIYLQGISQNSTEILIKLFYKYSIEKKLMESILENHKQCSTEKIKIKIASLLKEKPKKEFDRSVHPVFELVLPFLTKQERLNIILLNKTFKQKLQAAVLSTVLQEGVTMAEKQAIYNQLIPERFCVVSSDPEHRDLPSSRLQAFSRQPRHDSAGPHQNLQGRPEPVRGGSE